MSDFDAFETAAAFILIVVGAFQALVFVFLALKRMGRRSRSDASRMRRSPDRGSSVRL